MTEEELKGIIGGAVSVSGTFINSLSKLINKLLDLGRTIGSSIYYYRNDKSCKLS